MQDAAAPSERQSDVLDPARARAMQVMLGKSPSLAAGDALPAFFHQLYFWNPAPPEGLGRDGHPKVGGLIPDMGLPRRMWAGGRLVFERPVLLGRSAERITTCDSAVSKEGRTGPLAFVTLRHEIWQDDELRVTEWQDLVYRPDLDPSQPRPEPPRAPVDEDMCEVRRFDSTLLFRYSALTFNGHRIHYDQHYARDVEGYGGLVVHGPLMAQFLILMATEALGPLTTFSFRGTSPLTHHEQAEFCRKGRQFWVRGPDGRKCMQAKV